MKKEVKKLISKEEAISKGYIWYCAYCGTLYKNRPMLCRCKSNCFLSELNNNEQETGQNSKRSNNENVYKNSQS